VLLKHIKKLLIIEAYNRLITDFVNPLSTPNHPADKIDKAYIISLQNKQIKTPGQVVPENKEELGQQAK